MLNKFSLTILVLFTLLTSSIISAHTINSMPFSAANMEALLIESFNTPYFNGNVTGTVLETGSNEPLIGANVIIKGTLKGIATDVDGKFRITGIESGTQTLVISYLGFKSKEVIVEIVDGKTLEVNIIMEWEGVQGEEVTITAQARGQVAAINQQLQSNTITNVVSKDRIQELPDVNAAESIGRLPGVSIQRSGGEANKVSIRGLSPKYNTVTVNGVRVPSSDSDDRSVDLSLISSNMLDGIEVTKANTPDMDADALGGSIDLKLREAPVGFEGVFSAQGGYNQLQDYLGNYKVDLGLSNRFFNNKLGIVANFGIDEFNRSADQFSANYRRQNIPGTNERTTLVTSLNLQENSTIRGRTGTSFVVDYKIPNGKIIANTFYNKSESDGLNRSNNFAIDGGNRHYWNISAFEGTTSIFTSSLAVEQRVGRLEYEIGVSRTASNSESPENISWQFAQESGAFNQGVTPETQATDLPDWQVPDSTGTRLADVNISSNERQENVTSSYLNLKMPFDLNSSVNGYIKVGGKLKWMDRFNDEERIGTNGWQYSINPLTVECIDQALPEWGIQALVDETGGIPIREVLNENYNRSNFLDGDFDLGYALRENMMREMAQALIGCGEDIGAQFQAVPSLGRDYDGIERSQAAYMMVELNLGEKVTVIPGFRWEGDYSRYNGRQYREVTINNNPGPPADYDTLTSVRKNEFLLPMVHVQYNPLEWLKVRFARTETLTRPDYIRYAPRTSLNSQRTFYQASNTSLKPAHSTNYDLSVSLYENKLGLFTVSGFYKSIDDLILGVQYNLHPDIPVLPGLNIPDGTIDTNGNGEIDSQDANWVQYFPQGSTFINNPYPAEYRGIEFDWQTNFWYLPSLFKGLVLNLNYTYIESETEYGAFYIVDSDSIASRRPLRYYKEVKSDSTRIGRMPDQPTHIANVTLGYDYKGFSTRFSMLYQSDVSTSISSTNPESDQFSDEYLRFDVSARQRINEKLEFFLNLNNINSRPDGSHQAQTQVDRPTFRQYYGFTMDGGFRYRF